MASIIARAEVVGQFTAKHGWDCGIFDEDAVFAVCVLEGEGEWGDVFGDPRRVAHSSVIGACQGECVERVADRAWEAILQ